MKYRVDTISNEPNKIVLLTSIHSFRLVNMDIEFVRQGIRFVADSDKARRNLRKHGVSFERAAEAFFDPFLKALDANRNDEARDAILGMDETQRLLFVVHLVLEDERIRLISARKATREERRHYEND